MPVTAGAGLAALLLISPAGAGAAAEAERLAPGPKVAPGVFLAEAPESGPSGDRRAARLDGQPRIVGGSATTIAEWPWQAAITWKEPSSENGYERQFCGGSLVASTIIVTAAHCVYDFDSDTFRPASDHASITGRTTLSDSSQGQEIPWSSYFAFVDGSGRPLYDPDTNDWDVVFAQLAAPSNSTPIQVAGADEAASWAPGDENAWATGWGSTMALGPRSDTLQEVNIDRIADSTCGSASSYGSAFHPETMVCAGEMTGGQDTCQGDSGGPLVTPIGGGSFRLIGDTSWGLACAAPGFPGVYGRVAQDPMCSALQGGIQSVAGVNVVGPGGCLGASGAGPAPAPTDRSVTLDRNKAKVKKGKKVRITGRIDAPQNEAGCEPDQTVELQRKPKKAPDGAFATFNTLQSAASGQFAADVKVRKTRIYRALVHETATCDDELSNTKKVRTKKKKKKKKKKMKKKK